MAVHRPAPCEGHLNIATLAKTRTDDRRREAFREDVLTGLSQRQKVIPARWFYDRRGSELFEQITTLPEYSATRTEVSILRQCGQTIARIAGKGRVVVEFGAGSATKTPILFDAIDPRGYVPIDISGEFLSESCKDLAQQYPDLPIHPIEADFNEPVRLPPDAAGEALLGFFPGSTIGNMEPAAAVDLLRVIRATLGASSHLLIGMDRIKDREVLRRAYDDAAGVTADFNLNLLHRTNRELGGTIPVDAFRHRVLWNHVRARIEMHLEATRAVGFTVCGERFSMRSGETIHTENSHKYGERDASLLLLAGGWEPVELFADDDENFMVIFARAMAQVLTA